MEYISHFQMDKRERERERLNSDFCIFSLPSYSQNFVKLPILSPSKVQAFELPPEVQILETIERFCGYRPEKPTQSPLRVSQTRDRSPATRLKENQHEVLRRHCPPHCPGSFSWDNSSATRIWKCCDLASRKKIRWPRQHPKTWRRKSTRYELFPGVGADNRPWDSGDGVSVGGDAERDRLGRDHCGGDGWVEPRNTTFLLEKDYLSRLISPPERRSWPRQETAKPAWFSRTSLPPQIPSNGSTDE